MRDDEKSLLNRCAQSALCTLPFLSVLSVMHLRLSHLYIFFNRCASSWEEGYSRAKKGKGQVKEHLYKGPIGKDNRWVRIVCGGVGREE